MNWSTCDADEVKLLGKNYSAGRPYGITGVTIHHMAGDLDGNGCDSVWQNSGTSAHYSVDRNGKIVQHVWDGDRAWACGDGVNCNSGGNDKSISIEHANNARDPWTVHPAALDAGAHLVAALCKLYNLGRPEWMKNVFPHKHWSSTSCPGELAGSQNAEYMQKAQAYYDQMTGSSTPAPSPAPAPAKTVGQLADEVIAGKWGNDPMRSQKLKEAGYDPVAVQAEVNRKLGAPAPAPSGSSIVVGSKVTVTNPYDENGTHLAVSGTYDVMEVSGNRVVIGRGSAVTAAVPKGNLKLVSGGSVAPAPSGGSIVVGSTVKFTNPYDENGTHLAVSGTYTVMEVRGDRIVVGRGGAVTAAVPRKNLALA